MTEKMSGLEKAVFAACAVALWFLLWLLLAMGV